VALISSKPIYKLQKKKLQKISVIVASKNSGDTLDLCLESIMKQTVFSQGKVEIIVVDAKSIDNTPSILKRYADHIKVVYDQGEGLPKARNIGLGASTGDIVFHLDADFVLHKNAVKNCLKYFALGYDCIINRFGIVRGMGFWRTVRSLENIISLFYWGNAGNIRGASRFGGPRIFTRQILEEIHGYNENIKFYCEDEELRWRLIKANAKIKFANDVVFYKIEEKNLKTIFQKVFRYGYEMIDILGYNKKWIIIRIGGLYLNALLPILPTITAIIGFAHTKSVRISIGLFICKWIRMVGQSLGVLYRLLGSFYYFWKKKNNR